jgi:hypothetical protein
VILVRRRRTCFLPLSGKWNISVVRYIAEKKRRMRRTIVNSFACRLLLCEGFFYTLQEKDVYLSCGIRILF